MLLGKAMPDHSVRHHKRHDVSANCSGCQYSHPRSTRDEGWSVVEEICAGDILLRALECPIWTEDKDFFGVGIATWTSRTVELYFRE